MDAGADGVIQAWFHSNEGANIYRGVQVEGFEYQRYQNGATPAWIPLASPGHYYDAETGFFENWNRYYYPRTGTYLTPEPMYASGEFVMGYADAGIQLNPYAYVANNPMRYIDVNGLEPIAKDWRDATGRPQVEGLNGGPKPTPGQLWSSPNTLVGFFWGILGSAFGGDQQFKIVGDAIEFTRHPFMGNWAMTFGNSICYGSAGAPSPEWRAHEHAHVPQGEVLGPLYFPAHITAQTASRVQNMSWEAYDTSNWLELGPNMSPPRPWPW